MEYNSVIFARYIIANANRRGCSINMTKVQKLLYISYGTYLAVCDQRLLDEHPQAWPYGPVFPTTRRKLINVNFYTISMDDPEFDALRRDENVSDLMDLVFNTFGSWTAKQLSEWSHSEGSPWEKTVNADKFKWGARMSDDEIKGYFALMIKDKDGVQQ